MKKQKLARFMVLGVILLLSSMGLMAQKSASVQVTQVSNQAGWYDVQFADAASAYSLKALMADKAGKDAVINRLYIDEVRHVARIELIDKQLTLAKLQTLIEEKAVGSQISSSKSVNQSTK